MTARGTEHGDRAAFLARLGASAKPFVPGPHPAPPPAPNPARIGYRVLEDGSADDLVGLFVRSATEAGATVLDSPDGLAALVAEHGLRTAVRTPEPETHVLVDALAALGVTIGPYEPAAAAAADAGLTGAVAGVAVTGSLVVSTDAARARAASLLPRVHLCALARERIVATPADILRDRTDPWPSNLVFITGPSRTGDIEQILTTGVHGPTHVVIVLL